MDPKTWLRKKKSTEKNIVAAEKPNLTSIGNEEEILALLADKEELEKDLKKLNDKLSLSLSECKAKDELVKKHAKTAQEAVAGWEKAEAELLSSKQEMDESSQLRLVHEERVAHLDGALKECMLQLRFVREEQEQRIHDAVMKTSKEFEKSQMALEEQLSDTSRRLAKAEVENTHLSKALLVKENLIEDMKRHLTQMEADYNALMSRLESTEKDKASLNYEVRVLEKELEIRNEEREFNRRTADASHKQHLVGVKKIAKLESECQRLRVLVRKRLPGPAALAKMQNEVEMLGRDSVEIRRKKLNSSGLLVDLAVDSSPETPSKEIRILTEQLCAIEEENRTLKEALNKKGNELQFSRTMFSRTASKLSQLESQIQESPKGRQVTMDQPRSSLTSHEFSLASMSDIGSDDKVSCAESWASALISEVEHFRNGKPKGSQSIKSVGVSDINLMDDFVEMEKLAVVCAEKASGSSHASLIGSNAMTASLETGSNGFKSEVMGRDIIPLSDSVSGISISNREINSNYILDGKIPGWLQDILKVVLEHNRVAQRKPEEILKDIRVALNYINHPNLDELLGAGKNSDLYEVSNPMHFRDYIPTKLSNNSIQVDSSSGVTDADISLTKKSKQQFQSALSKSIGKIIELIEGISLPSLEHDSPDTLSKRNGNMASYKNIVMPTGYMVRIFQWKTSELSNILQQFLHVCYDLLNGKADLEKFSRELTVALDWILNHCFSLQDVSSMRDAIKKEFDWDESRSESEAEIGMTSLFSEADKLHIPREQLPCWLPITASDGRGIQPKDIQYNDREALKIFRYELVNVESEKKVLEERLQSATSTSESLINQLQESEKTISSLKLELQTLKESNGLIVDQTESHKLSNEDLNTQLIEAKVDELNEARQKFSSLDVELGNRNNCSEEAKCLELQLQLESGMNEHSNNDTSHREKQLRADWEITAASEKLAECQETIINLGKQLKALAAPKGASLLDKVTSTPNDKHTTPTSTTITDLSPTHTNDMYMKQRSSLLDQMLAEDDAKANDFRTPKVGQNNSPPSFVPGPIETLQKILSLNGIENQDDNASVTSLAIVPSKKQGGGSLWRKLLRRKKKSSGKKTPVPLST
ncbi:filament-like plant protein 7 [Quillaja saponaria]|uniref:Filament-like plant protein 7 n=1 Tax=Quillaja saponaria TaxID=32244 RepID=A0AAD7P705_QUISA|nr:filament-like plant protein 7 [Quillaja saponaria]